MEEFKRMSGNPELTEGSFVMACRTDWRNEKEQRSTEERLDSWSKDLWIGRRVQ